MAKSAAPLSCSKASWAATEKCPGEKPVDLVSGHHLYHGIIRKIKLQRMSKECIYDSNLPHLNVVSNMS